jgi:hypothetical protein
VVVYRQSIIVIVIAVVHPVVIIIIIVIHLVVIVVVIVHLVVIVVVIHPVVVHPVVVIVIPSVIIHPVIVVVIVRVLPFTGFVLGACLGSLACGAILPIRRCAGMILPRGVGLVQGSMLLRAISITFFCCGIKRQNKCKCCNGGE